MIRRSNLYRRLWHVNRRNSGKIHVILRVMAIILLFTSLVAYSNRKILPYLEIISENKVEATINKVISNAVKKVFDEEVRFDDTLIINKDDNGKVISIDTNVAKLNKLSVRISSEIIDKLSSMEKERVSVPFGVLLGDSIFSGIGPELFITIQPYGNIEVEFMSEYIAQGINQTKHMLYLQIKIRAGIRAPLVLKKTEIITNIPVIETIILVDS